MYIARVIQLLTANCDFNNNDDNNHNNNKKINLESEFN